MEHEHGPLRQKKTPFEAPEWAKNPVPETPFQKLVDEKNKMEEELTSISYMLNPDSSGVIALPEGVENPEEYEKNLEERFEFLEKRIEELKKDIELMRNPSSI